MANDNNDGRPLQPLPDQHPGDGGEPSGFSGYGDTTRKRFESAYGRPMPSADSDVAGERKRQIEESYRTDGAAQRRGVRPRR